MAGQDVMAGGDWCADRFGALVTHRGAVLVEFALTLPILMLIVAGLFDFGLAFQRQLALTNAAREGARMAVLAGYSTADVQSRVAQYLTATGVVESPTTTVTAGQIASGAGQTLAVAVSIDYAFTILKPVATLVGGTFDKVTLTGRSEMRVEVAAGGS